MADVLLVTTTVRVLNGVHCHTTHLGPRVALDAVLVVRASSLQDGLVNTTAAGHDSDLSTRIRHHRGLATRGETQTGLASVSVVSNDGSVVSRGTGELATVTRSLLNIAHDGTFGHGAERRDVANLELCILAAVDELPSVHTLDSNEVVLVELVLVRVAENDAGERGTTTGVMNDFLDDTLDVAVSLSEIQRAELGSSFTVLVVALEDTTRTLALCSDDASHF